VTSVKLLGDIWAAELDNNAFLAGRRVQRIFETCIGVESIVVTQREDGGENELCESLGREVETEVDLL
jgi:hypothetical protein